MEIAADWFDRQDTLCDAERRELDQWLSASPDHARAYGMVRQTMLDVALLDVIAEKSAEALPEKTTPDFVSTLNERFQTVSKSLAEIFSTRTSWAIASAAMLAIIAAPITISSLTRTAPVTDALVFATAISERSQYTLSDDSIVFLDANTSVEAKLDASKRTATLNKGEAVFDVTKDENKPFHVHAGSVSVMVTGTRFSVCRLEKAVDIRVHDGSVRVVHNFGDAITLTQGERVIIDQVKGVQTGVVDENAFENWRSGWLEADAMALSHVVERLNRYTNAQILINDHQLAYTAISGRFRLNNTDHTLAQLEVLLDIKINKFDNRIELSPTNR